MSRARDYCFTSYLETEPVFEGNCSYLAYGRKLTPSTGKHHWQGYAEFKSPKTIAACQKTLKIGKAHVEKRQGTPGEATGYCMKGDREKPEGRWIMFAHEKDNWGNGDADGSQNRKQFGERSPELEKGKRTDIVNFRDSIKRGATDTELVESLTLLPAAS